MVECMGGCSLYTLVVKLSNTKNNKNKIHMALDGRRLSMVHTTTTKNMQAWGSIHWRGGETGGEHARGLIPSFWDQ